MKVKKLFTKGKRAAKKMGKEFGRTPLARAAKGKHTKGFI